MKQKILDIIAIVFVLAVLACLLCPLVVFRTPRGPGRRSVCMNNESQLALALLNYDSEHGHLPPPYTVDENGKPLHSWRTLLLPYLEYNELFSKIRFDEPWDSPHNSQFHSLPMPIFQCPSVKNNQDRTVTHYDVVVGENTAFPPFDPETKTLRKMIEWKKQNDKEPEVE